METIVLVMLALSIYSINAHYYKKGEYKKAVLANSIISLLVVSGNTAANFASAIQMGALTLTLVVLASSAILTFILCLPLVFKVRKQTA